MTIIECPPIQNFLGFYIGLNLLPPSISTNESFSRRTYEFFPDALRKVAFNFLVCSLESPT